MNEIFLQNVYREMFIIVLVNYCFLFINFEYLHGFSNASSL
jgi:hypothetical protein